MRLLFLCVVALLYVHHSVVHMQAAEALSLEFKVRSMYYDPSDSDTNPNGFGGTVANGVPDKTRADALDTWYKANNSNDNRFHYYFGWRKAVVQPKGAVTAVVWIERASDGKFIKTLGRWAGHTAHGTFPNSKKNARVYGFEVFHSPYYFVHGIDAGRAYDLSRFNGNYGNPAGSANSNIRAVGAGSLPIHAVRGASPFDGEVTDYDAVLGPTVGCQVANVASSTADNPSLVSYLTLDDPATLVDDASILSTVPTVPFRTALTQPQAWNMTLEWDPINNVTGATALPPGDYNIIIEAIEWAMEGEHYSSLVSTAGRNTNQSIAFFRHKDHFKTIGYTYDGQNWSLRSGFNVNDYYATDSMRREGISTDQYTNPFTGNTLVRDVNEPAVIYDINVQYTPPAATLPPTAIMNTPANNAIFLQGANIAFSGSASDTEDGVLSGSSLSWSSNRDGILNTGTSFNRSNLSVNVHTITLTATDSSGKTHSVSRTITVHRAPTASIQTAGQTINAGVALSLVGSGSDPDGGAVSYAWTSSRDGSLGSTASVNAPSLSIGTHIISLRVTDILGAQTTANITVIVNAFPTATINNPASAVIINSGTSITFTGSATDPENGTLSGASVMWSSSRDGNIGNGTTRNMSTLSVGVHTITFTATDANNASASDTVQVTVNALPTATINTPANNANFISGVNVALNGSGNDAEDGNLTGASLQWSSSLNGNLGSGSTRNITTLSAGTHVISLMVTDSRGATATATRSITITDPVNTVPVVTISNPATALNINQGSAVNLIGSATDVEDGTLTGGALVWTSSISGALGTGSTLNNVLLGVGTHTITLTATDSGNASGTKAVVITVNAPPVANISSPNNQVFVTGANVIVNGSGVDPEDGNLSGSSLKWFEGVNLLGTGAQLSINSLGVGVHVITLTVTDSKGMSHSTSVNIRNDNAPSILMTAPINNAVFVSGASIQFTATASDTEDGNLSASIVWASNRDGVIGNGASFNKVLSDNSHTITATITDSASTARSVTRQITIGAAPQVSIASPVNNAVALVGATVSFSGSAIDIEDGSLTGSALVWSSSLQGNIGTGNGFNRNNLQAGTHDITLLATDSDGISGSATVSLVIHNKPNVAITAPANNSVVGIGQTVNFTATAVDPEDGALSGAQVQWSSDRDGNIGTGINVSRNNLSGGTHIITVSATDSRGAQSTASRTLNVNSSPTVTIQTPINTTFTLGDQIIFSAIAADNEDILIPAAQVRWSSNVDGFIGTGESLSYSGLSIGTHSIQVQATDSLGASTNDQITVTVVPAAAVAESFTVQFRSSTMNGSYAPTNVLAVWVETQSGQFIKTMGRWAGERSYSLETWTNAAGNDVDGVMGATRTSHASQLQTTWNINTNIYADAVYKIKLEMAENDTYADGAARLATITLNKNGTPQSASNINVSGFSITSWSYSGRPPQIQSALTGAAPSGLSYSYQITANNGANSFSASGLPSGLSINTSTGLISGVPSGNGPFSISINASNSAGTDTKTLVLTLDGKPIINSGLSVIGEQGIAFSYTITGLNAPTTFSASGLPSGLIINTNSGVISGSPTQFGNFNVSIGASNANGTDNKTLQMNIGQAGLSLITSSTTVSAEAGVPFSYAITASNNPLSFTATALPSGLTLNSTSGLISGTPAANTADPLNPLTVSLRALNIGGTGPIFTLQLRVLFNPSVARDINIRILDPQNAMPSDVQAEQNQSTVYSGLDQSVHAIQAIDKNIETVITFPPGGTN